MSDDLSPFLSRVPEEFVAVDTDLLDGTVTADGSAAGSDDDPTARARQLLEGAKQVELLTPFVIEAYVDALREHVLGGTPVDVVATGGAGRALREGPLAAVAPLVAGTDRVHLSVHDHPAPFACLLRPDRVAFALAREGNGGDVDLVYESEGEAARAWARGVFDVYRAKAEPL